MTPDNHSRAPRDSAIAPGADGDAPPAAEAFGTRDLAAYRDGAFGVAHRAVPLERAVALSYQGSTHAVMMATPADLADFALRFSLAEGIVAAPADIARLDIRDHPKGVSLEMWLAPERAARHEARRRAVIGPTGCGLCGVESLEAAMPDLAPVTSDLTVTPAGIANAMARLAPTQALGRTTRAVHAAALLTDETLVAREDVGRHNALDKVAGAAAGAGLDAGRGMVLLTSRVSVEMVAKTARLGAPILVAVSAPTDLACETAERSGITLVVVARGESFEVITHPYRVLGAV